MNSERTFTNVDDGVLVKQVPNETERFGPVFSDHDAAPDR
jgi:hypothetical protein